MFIFELINVSKSYKIGEKELQILKDVNISFPTKGLVSILGKSGCGKSTFLNLLSGIDRPNSGIIKYKGNNINKFNNKELKNYQNNEIGILFQHFNLFENLSCMDNVIIPSLINGKRRKDSIKDASILFDKFNLNKLRNRVYKDLSGGEKQRIALLRCLINNPSVIICDEPTGALDKKNSLLIMDELKLVSKDKLVILVTHNEFLSNRYKDYLIDFNNKLELKNEIKNSKIIINKRNKNCFSLLFTFIKLHLKKHFIRNSIVSISIMFSSLCFLLSFGYIEGAKTSKEEYTKKSLLYNYATISKKKIIDIPSSPIRISKLSRPELIELDFIIKKISSIQVKNNYQIYLPAYPSFSFNDKEIDNINFSSYYFPNLNLLKNGRYPIEDSFNEVIVNEEFLNFFNINVSDALGSFIKLNFTSSITNSFDKKKIKDEIVFNQSLKIVGIISEFSYLNEPRVYYSHKGLELFLKGIDLDNFSKEIKTVFTAKDAIDFADNTDINSSYSYLLFVENLNQVNALKGIKKELETKNEYEISSINFTIAESYYSLVDITSTSLIVFMVLIMITMLLIIIISSYSSYIQNKKESAVLSILGLRRNKLFLIYNLENILVSLFGLTLSFFVYIPSKNFANSLLYNFARLENVISLNLFSKFNLILLISLIVITTLSSLIPFLIYDKNYVLQELRDE